MKILQMIIIFTGLLFPVNSFALSCVFPRGKELVQQYDIIFEGRASSTKNIPSENFKQNEGDVIRGQADTITTFIVDRIIKGNISDEVEIMHPGPQSRWGRSFLKDVPMIIFARYSTISDDLYISICNSSFILQDDQSFIHPTLLEKIIQIEDYYNKKKTLEELSNKYKTQNVYYERFLFLDDYHDYELVKKLYEDTNLIQRMGNFILLYARALYYLGEYDRAYKAITSYNFNYEHYQEANNIKILSLIKLKNIEKLELENISISDVILNNIDLSNVNLERAIFSKSKLSHLNLNNTNLTGANIADSQLLISEGPNINLSGAVISSSLISGNLSNVDLSYAFVKNSTISGKLDGAHLEKTNFSGSRISSSLSGAILEDANFENTFIHSLSGAVLKNTNLNGIQSRSDDLPASVSNYTGTDLSDFDLSNGNFHNTDFSNSKFINTDLSNVSFRGSVFKNVDFLGANLEGAIFLSLQDNPADLRSADLSKAKIKNTHFASALFDCNTKFPKNFDPYKNAMINVDGNCNNTKTNKSKLPIEDMLKPPYQHYRLLNEFEVQSMAGNIQFTNKIKCKWGEAIHSKSSVIISGQDFSGCSVSRVDFSGANLDGANFKGAYLYGAKFDETNIVNIRLDGARVTNSTIFPDNFDATKFKLVPTGVIEFNGNSIGSLWQASKMKGRKKYTETGSYRPPAYNVPDFINLNMDEINYTAAWLPNSNMSGSSLRMTDFSASNLMGVNFTRADLTGAVLYDALLDNADFTRTNLYGADLRWARLTGAKLKRTNLENALYDDNTVWPKDFDPTKSGAYYVASKDTDLETKLPENVLPISLSDNIELIALGIYRGKSKDGGSCGHKYEENCVINVKIQKTDKPIFLILSAYESSMWRINAANGVRIEGVIMGGFYGQSIQGVPGSTKVINYSNIDLQNKNNFDFHEDKDEGDLIKMSSVVKALTGREVNSILLPNKDKNFEIN
ncbi:MAG: pentapeptide repeat-containing protein [Alphaproteobacteria bacterium]|nr:pentapeptide repeat-containing protein [Alphaproteobacteria bacterium]